MKFNEIWANLWKSLINDETGFSVKKCIAVFVCVVIIAPICFIYTDHSNFVAVLVTLTTFVCTLLGIAAKEKNDVLKANKPDA